jgi:hypothetical protein
MSWAMRPARIAAWLRLMASTDTERQVEVDDVGTRPRSRITLWFRAADS